MVERGMICQWLQEHMVVQVHYSISTEHKSRYETGSDDVVF